MVICRKTRARKEEDKQAKREQILAAAAKLFTRMPFEDIKVERIAEACGFAKGTVYLYFPSKEELFLELYERELDAWFARTSDLFAQKRPEDVIETLVDSI